MNISQTLIAFYCISIAPLHITHAQESAPTKGSDTAPDSEGFSIILPDTEAKDESSTDTKNASSEDLTLELPDTSEQGSRESDETIYILDDFVVTSEGDKGYYSANTISATRTNSLVKNTPISLQVVNEQALADLNILSDEDLALVSPSIAYDPDNFSLNQIRIRGFRSLTSRYDLFFRELPRDNYNTQRVDIVKGANSLIYGQADPGGKVNNVPKLALQNKNYLRVKTSFGSDDYQRHELDANKVITDQLSVRVMAVDFETEYDQDYREREFTGATIEASYRPFENTELRMHVETVDSDQNFPSRMFLDSRDNSVFGINNNADRILNEYQNEGLLTPDYIDFLPSEVIANVIDKSNGKINSKGDLKKLYDLGLDQDEYNTFSGPDKSASQDGEFIVLDWTQRLTDDLQFKIAYNHARLERDGLTRESFAANRVRGEELEQYVQGFWRETEGETTSDGVRSTLLWSKELDDSSHNFLFGYDFDRVDKDPRLYDQIRADILNDPTFDGSYSSAQRAWDALTIADGFDSSRQGMRFNDVIDDPDGLGNSADYDGDAAAWAPFRHTPSTVDTHGFWLASQSKFFDDRLHTLIGIRYDTLDIDSEFEDYSVYGADGTSGPAPAGGSAFDTFKQSSSYDEWSPSVGAIFWLTPEWAVFANYAESFQSPNGVNRQVTGEVAPPETGEGYEYGIRFDLFEGKLNGQINVFYIEKENDRLINYNGRELAAIYPEGSLPPEYDFLYNGAGTAINTQRAPGTHVPGDISRSEGVEVEFYYNPTNQLSFTFAYAYINLDAIDVNDAVADEPNAGRIYGVAPHYANLIGRYRFTDGALKGFSFGANHRWRSSSEQASYLGIDGKYYDVEFDDEHTTGVFMNYQKRLSSAPLSPLMSLGFRIDNVFDHDDLINRNSSGLYRDGRKYIVSAGLEF
jgi:outer membrane receptor protein involved in Fe transport